MPSAPHVNPDVLSGRLLSRKLLGFLVYSLASVTRASESLIVNGISNKMPASLSVVITQLGDMNGVGGHLVDDSVLVIDSA